MWSLGNPTRDRNNMNSSRIVILYHAYAPKPRRYDLLVIMKAAVVSSLLPLLFRKLVDQSFNRVTATCSRSLPLGFELDLSDRSDAWHDLCNFRTLACHGATVSCSQFLFLRCSTSPPVGRCRVPVSLGTTSSRPVPQRRV